MINDYFGQFLTSMYKTKKNTIAKTTTSCFYNWYTNNDQNNN